MSIILDPSAGDGPNKGKIDASENTLEGEQPMVDLPEDQDDEAEVSE